MRPFLSILFLAVVMAATAQTGPVVTIFGAVRTLLTDDTLKNVSITAMAMNDTVPIAQGRMLPNGGYELILDRSMGYQIQYNSPNHVSKIIEIGSAQAAGNIPEGGYGMQIDINLPKAYGGIDFSSLKEPAGRAIFDPLTGSFRWDDGYSASIRERQAALLEEYRKKLEEEN